jgi:hypothetical protein
VGADYSGATQAFTDIGDVVLVAVPMIDGYPPTQRMSETYGVEAVHRNPSGQR